jgi:hypothetical protein
MKKFGRKITCAMSEVRRTSSTSACQHAKAETGQTKSAPMTESLMIRCTPAGFAALIQIRGRSGTRLRQAYGAAGPRPTKFGLPLRLAQLRNQFCLLQRRSGQR